MAVFCYSLLLCAFRTIQVNLTKLKKYVSAIKKWSDKLPETLGLFAEGDKIYATNGTHKFCLPITYGKWEARFRVHEETMRIYLTDGVQVVYPGQKLDVPFEKEAQEETKALLQDMWAASPSAPLPASIKPDAGIPLLDTLRGPQGP